ncbi:MAG: hypothetical protein ISS43_02035 [Candidatus Omnitrophica bacterium]|nr:hypothetical protein [Candidatus Omnitrophota bacterium]
MKLEARRLLLVFILLSAFSFQLSALCGCEAFRKKFVRKPKEEKQIEVVVHTQEYSSEYSPEQIYKKYFLFWRSWHEELVNSLNAQEGNRKKLISAAKKSVENLQQMRQLLLPEKQDRLDIYILEQKSIVRELNKRRLSPAQRLKIKTRLEKQRRQIQKEFGYSHIQEHLIKK